MDNTEVSIAITNAAFPGHQTHFYIADEHMHKITDTDPSLDRNFKNKTQVQMWPILWHG